MRKFRKVIALGLALLMAASMAACGSSNEQPSGGEDGGTPTATPPAQSTDTSEATPAPVPTDRTETRIINVGCWWVPYYDSSHASVEDDPTYAGLEVAHRKFDVVKEIEEKYNIEFYFQNLTYEGTEESLVNSVLAGSPDCDIYMVELNFGIPAALNGLTVDLKTVLPSDHDLFTDQKYVTYLDLGDGKASILKRKEASAVVEATYPLAFNLQMIQNNNLEDPRDLYAKGEWTWSKFIEYCQVLTQDTDGDGQIDQYGYGGYIHETLQQLLMSNGANIAPGPTEQLTSNATGEVLQMISDMYNVYNFCLPYDLAGIGTSDNDTMRFAYREGNIGFYPCAAWINSDANDYDYEGTGSRLPFDTVYIQWPVGPSGNAATNAGKFSGGEYYVIPAGVEDPEEVFNVLFDYWNWYDGDISLRDDEDALAWWYTVTAADIELQDHNFSVMFDVGSRETFELYNALGFDMDFQGLIDGSVTPAQFQETYKQQVQEALDAYFGE